MSWFEVTANAYIWCDPRTNRCTQAANPSTGTYEIYIELVVVEVSLVATTAGPYAPGSDTGPTGRRLLYQATCVASVQDAPADQNFADQTVRALALAGIAISVGGKTVDMAQNYGAAAGLELPRGAGAAGAFLAVAGFGVNVATSVANGESLLDAVVQEGSEALTDVAVGAVGGAAGALLASAICGPGAPMCAAAVMLGAGLIVGGVWSAVKGTLKDAMGNLGGGG